jgi:hypothetical protein
MGGLKAAQPFGLGVSGGSCTDGGGSLEPRGSSGLARPSWGGGWGHSRVRIGTTVSLV